MLRFGFGEWVGNEFGRRRRVLRYTGKTGDSVGWGGSMRICRIGTLLPEKSGQFLLLLLLLIFVGVTCVFLFGSGG